MASTHQACCCPQSLYLCVFECSREDEGCEECIPYFRASIPFYPASTGFKLGDKCYGVREWTDPDPDPADVRTSLPIAAVANAGCSSCDDLCPSICPCSLNLPAPGDSDLAASFMHVWIEAVDDQGCCQSDPFNQHLLNAGSTIYAKLPLSAAAGNPSTPRVYRWGQDVNAQDFEVAVSGERMYSGNCVSVPGSGTQINCSPPAPNDPKCTQTPPEGTTWQKLLSAGITFTETGAGTCEFEMSVDLSGLGEYGFLNEFGNLTSVQVVFDTHVLWSVDGDSSSTPLLSNGRSGEIEVYGQVAEPNCAESSDRRVRLRWMIDGPGCLQPLIDPSPSTPMQISVPTSGCTVCGNEPGRALTDAEVAELAEVIG